MSATHTPTPWIFDEIMTSCGRCFRIGSAEQIAARKPRGGIPSYACLYDDWGQGENATKANAAFIVRAVNSFDDLVAALKRLDAYWLQEFPAGPSEPENTTNLLVQAIRGRLAAETIDIWNDIRAALAKAEGQP